MKRVMIVGISVLLLLTVGFFLLSSENQPVLYAASWDAVYEFQLNESFSLNVIMLEKKKWHESSSIRKVKEVSLPNSGLNVDDFFIERGERIKDHYRLVNLILDISAEKEGSYEAKTIEIVFDDESTHAFDIGHLLFHVTDRKTDRIFQPVESYTVIYPELEFSAKLQNQSTEEIVIESIELENRTITLSDIRLNQHAFNEPVHLSSGESFTIEFTFAPVEQGYPFYAISPLIRYRLGEREYFERLPLAMYRLSSITEELIDEIITNGDDDH
ncbi:hypothetical protein CathTA2_0692 [Caldalkalibacillus thermarum TA2.A1]|uniref:Uncharacterized protein n=1 Tax=Caldalkalibacillus thermarum (strain TA2.A1) TaxID=986075 RepID=F5L4H9_CALTT|nr:hypothetical protein [Caldalkalibacillus thermarum]EGL83759.1 hypothetical protein CathTA2_0692 [Caldalkalibacillus thermarum TA2.A1]QZT33869.1 hypothetical protein HUR95_16975 [Caldalkalibacillus thermarum TA2.A1]